jgi:hypothetical protein
VDGGDAGAEQMDVVGVGGVRDVARAQAHAGATHQDRLHDRPPDVGMKQLAEALRAGEAAGEERLDERVARVEVTDDCEEVTRPDCFHVRGGDLHVGALEDRERPGRPVVREHRRAARRDRLVVAAV